MIERKKIALFIPFVMLSVLGCLYAALFFYKINDEIGEAIFEVSNMIIFVVLVGLIWRNRYVSDRNL
jgi:hypothetical protein